MKKIILSIFAVAATLNLSAQETETKNSKNFDRWSVELDFGVNKVRRPMSPGYKAESPGLWNGGIGVRYMLTPMFGFKAGFVYNNIESSSNSKSFQTDYMRYGLEGVINAGRLLRFEDFTNRVGLLLHAGAAYGTLDGNKFPGKDEVVSVMAGATVQFKLSNKFALSLEGNVVNNFSQSRAWDGGRKNTGTINVGGGINVDGQNYPIDASIPNEADRYLNRFANIMFEGTIGLTYYIGKSGVHADWYTDDMRFSRLKEFEELEARVASLETMLVDSDKDGVADYLDVEPNSTPGVAVDHKGQVIDKNSNGIPDELEQYIESKYGNLNKQIENLKGDNALVKQFVNDGYVATYFDFNKTQPTNVSTEGIDFIRTYLMNNPNATVDILGHADEIGTANYNFKLANTRAENVKSILVKSGIDANRLNVISKGADTSVDVNSAGARKLVRRVTFQIK